MMNNLEQNRTTIRIWTSGDNPIHLGQGIGHVSIELPNLDEGLYISLWPRTSINLFQIFDKTQHRLHSLLDDQLVENRNPEVKYNFYTLNLIAMRAKFEEMQETLLGWRALGNLFVKEQDTAENCASIAYKILQAGDVMGILPSIDSQSSKLSSAGGLKIFRAPFYGSELTSASIVLTPDALVEILKKAKLSEYTNRPETKDILDPAETHVPLPVNQEGWQCSVM